jgi:hypothetical protein
MNELIPKGWEKERADIARELVIDAVDGLVTGNYAKYRDNTRLLREMRATGLVRRLNQISDLIAE